MEQIDSEAFNLEIHDLRDVISHRSVVAERIWRAWWEPDGQSLADVDEALDMVLSGHFHGPLVLLGISLTTADEARFFRAVVRASEKLGPWPMAMLFRTMPLMVRSAKTTPVHKRELLEDVKENRARDAVRVSSEYLDYIAADQDVAARLAASGNPTWLVHAERGDGGLTDAERTTLEAASNVTLVVLPGAVFFLPDEAPRRVAEVIAAAVAHAS